MKRIAVLAGGFSGESVVSLKSADMIMQNIDKVRFDPCLVVIDKSGWNAIDEKGQKMPVDKNNFSWTAGNEKVEVEGVFIIIHGDPGENGVIQGYFDLIGMPYTTGGVWSMSTTFNKSSCNDYLSHHGYKTAKNLRIRKNELYSTGSIVSELGLPVFVKPNKGGSSIATSRVDEKEALHKAIELAFTVDEEVILEEFLDGKEVTCGVIVRDGEILALPLTEIVSENDFFDYQAKYEGKSQEITPARVMEEEKNEVQRVSKELYQLLNCRGMIRVDYMIVKGKPCIIEVNTVPGFSAESIIPQQAAAIGISKTDLISMVIDSCM